jgi:6-phosphogluconolactonase (cycloisomerase 2 family)
MWEALMLLRRTALLCSFLFILVLTACGGGDNNNNGGGPGGGGGGGVQDYLLATDAGRNNVVVFNIASDGTIGTSVGGPVSAGTSPSASVLNTSSGIIYVANAGSNSISAFIVNADGTLTKAASDINSGGVKPVALAISSGGDFLAVLNQQSFNVSVFTIDLNTGALAPLTSAATASGEAPVAMALDPAGDFLYVTTDSTIQLFDFASGSGESGDISFVNTLLTFDQQTISSPTFSADGRFIYLAGSLGGVYGFTIFNDGTLEQLTGTPIAAGTLASNLVIDSSGTLLYATDSTGGKIYGFAIAPATGALSNLPGSPYAALAGAGVMALDPTESFLYVAQNGTVNAYSIAANGSLTKINGQYNGDSISSLLTYEVQ